MICTLSSVSLREKGFTERMSTKLFQILKCLAMYVLKSQHALKFFWISFKKEVSG